MSANPAAPSPVVVELFERLRIDARGSGVVWSLDGTGDMNANLVRLEADEMIDTHVNREVDVVLVVLSGTGRLELDGRDHALAPGVLARVSKGSSRSLRAGPDGLAYVTVHRRRAPLGITGTRGSSR